MINSITGPLDDPNYDSNSLVTESYLGPTLTPRDFEIKVQQTLDMQGLKLSDYKSQHREVIPTTDGEYEFDVTARFSALDVHFLVLIECKAQKASVKRDEVQKLFAKMQSVGAQKGIPVFNVGLSIRSYQVCKSSWYCISSDG